MPVMPRMDRPDSWDVVEQEDGTLRMTPQPQPVAWNKWRDCVEVIYDPAEHVAHLHLDDATVVDVEEPLMEWLQFGIDAYYG